MEDCLQHAVNIWPNRITLGFLQTLHQIFNRKSKNKCLISNGNMPLFIHTILTFFSHWVGQRFTRFNIKTLQENCCSGIWSKRKTLPPGSCHTANVNVNDEVNVSVSESINVDGVMCGRPLPNISASPAHIASHSLGELLPGGAVTAADPGQGNPPGLLVRDGFGAEGDQGVVHSV